MNCVCVYLDTHCLYSYKTFLQSVHFKECVDLPSNALSVCISMSWKLNAVWSLMVCSDTGSQCWRVWHWPETLKGAVWDKKYASQQSPRTHAVLIEYLRQGRLLPKAPTLSWVPTLILNWKFLGLVFSKICCPTFSHQPNQRHLIWTFIHGDSDQKFYTAITDKEMPLFVRRSLFSHAQRPLLIPLCKLRQSTIWILLRLACLTKLFVW